MSIFAVAEESTASPVPSLIFLGVMIAVFYFLIIRPQRQRLKKQQAVADSLNLGDEVRTIGGIHGQVVSLDDTSVVLDVEQGRIRIARRAIGSVVAGEDT